MKCIDLFSGLGGFSEAFIDRGHDVIRYDNDGRFAEVPNTIIKDVMLLTIEDLANADIILASPPCQCFSVASIGRYWDFGGVPKNEKTKDAIALVRYTLQLVQRAKPHYWIIENPRGMMRHVLGHPTITTYWNAWGAPYLKPTDLWGLLPVMDWPKPKGWTKAKRGVKEGIQAGLKQWNEQSFSRNTFAYLGPRLPALRSLIPYRFSLALCIAAEGNLKQRTLEAGE